MPHTTLSGGFLALCRLIEKKENRSEIGRFERLYLQVIPTEAFEEGAVRPQAGSVIDNRGLLATGNS